MKFTRENLTHTGFYIKAKQSVNQCRGGGSRTLATICWEAKRARWFFFQYFLHFVCVWGMGWDGQCSFYGYYSQNKCNNIKKNYKRNKREKKEVKASREENDINLLSRRLFIYEGTAESSKRARTRTRIRTTTIPLTLKKIRIYTYHDRSLNWHSLS